ncbi:hypothetical protein JDV02_006621 [Purpureocillium takamizusanense]|uniref:Uncharacterized protein n=1 Tax=Purpureocillium takamizusanense TaxID=2060973 RepID=A0A9Q8QIP6_9HYPO|nr:uncharacterized protein JDV02_006621 [Purpureocillium takamizusanense]UNI20543.1 hypothetical protein JDV02_006621 [Purpureocillium takamizusanense]
MISWPLETPGRGTTTTTTTDDDGDTARKTKRKRYGFARNKQNKGAPNSPPPSPPPTPRPPPTPPRTPPPPQQQDGTGSAPAQRAERPEAETGSEVVALPPLLLSVMTAKVQSPRRKPLPVPPSIAPPPCSRSSIATTALSVSPCSPRSPLDVDTPPLPSPSWSLRASSFPLPPPPTPQPTRSNSARVAAAAVAGTAGTAAAGGGGGGEGGHGNRAKGKWAGKHSPRPDSTTLPRSPSSCRHSFPPRSSSLDPERFYALLHHHHHHRRPRLRCRRDDTDAPRPAAESQTQTQSQTHYWLPVEDVLAGLPGRHHLPPGHWEAMLDLAHAVRLADARDSGYDWVQLVTGWCEEDGG